MHSEHINAKIQMYEQDHMTNDTAKIMAKAGRLDNYEKIFHMFH